MSTISNEGFIRNQRVYGTQIAPVMMAGSIQLGILSQLRLCETPVEPTGTPMWFTLEVEEEEEEEVEFGRPPKLMLIFGRSARNPSCHSFMFKLSTEPLISERATI